MQYITGFFDLLNNIFLKMTWLSDSIRWLTINIFRLPMNDETWMGKLGGSLQFFIYDSIKILILLSVLIFIFSYIESKFTPEEVKKKLSKVSGIKGNIFGALLGTVTPFCSCSSIPIFISFTKAKLPLGVTFSFLISSPFVDLAACAVLASVFGIKVAIAYVLVGIILAVVGGIIISKLKMENQVEEYVYKMSVGKNEEEKLTKKQRVSYAKDQVRQIFKRVWKYVLIGVGIGAIIHNWIPQNFIELILGNKNIFAPVLASIIGIPMYADIFGTIPVAEALFAKGVGIGTVLAFMMSVTALSIPSIVMLKKVIKPKLLYTFVGIVTTGIIIIGYLFNIFGYLII